MTKKFKTLLAATVATSAIAAPVAFADNTTPASYEDGFYIEVEGSETGKFYTFEQFNALPDVEKVALLDAGLDKFRVFISGVGSASLQEIVDADGDAEVAFTNNGSLGTEDPSQYIPGEYKGVEEPEPTLNTEALDAAKEAAAELNEEDYTAESWEALEAALAFEVTEETTQEEIDAAVAAINEAIEALVDADEEVGELAVESVSAINNTQLEVTLVEATTATAEDFKVELDGEAVAVESAVAGTGNKVYTLVIEDLFGAKGELTVNGKSINVDFSEGALSLAIGAVQTANKDNIIERLNAPILGITDVKDEYAEVYVIARDNVLGDTPTRIQNNIVTLTNEKLNKAINETYIPFTRLAQPPTNTEEWTKGVVKAAEAWETAISERGQREALTDLATSLYILELYGLKDISTDVTKPGEKGGQVATIASKTSDAYKALEKYAEKILADKPTTLAGVQAVIDASLSAAELEEKAEETVEEFEDLVDALGGAETNGNYNTTLTAKLAQEALVRANGLVSQLPSGDLKTELEGKINSKKTAFETKVESHAKKAVADLFTEKGENTDSTAENITDIAIEDLKDEAKYDLVPTTQLELNQALAAVELLPATTLRTALNVRVNVAQERFDSDNDVKALAAATKAVNDLFTGYTVNVSAGKSVKDVRDDVRELDADAVVAVTSQTTINKAAEKVAELKDSAPQKAKLQMAVDTYKELVAREAVAALINGVNAGKAGEADSIMTTSTLVADKVTWTNVLASTNVSDEKSFDDATTAVNALTNSGSLAVKTRLVSFLDAAKAEYAKHAVSVVYNTYEFDTIIAATEQDLKDEGLASGDVSVNADNISAANKAVALVADAGTKANLQAKVDLANLLVLNIAVNSESDAVAALGTLKNEKLIDAGVQGGKEVASLVFATRTDDNGTDPQEFSSVEEAVEVVENAVENYNNLLNAINDATSVAQMQKALNAVNKAYKGANDILDGDLVEFASQATIADAEKVLTNLKALKNPSDKNMAPTEFKNLKDVVVKGFEGTPGEGETPVDPDPTEPTDPVDPDPTEPTDPVDPDPTEPTDPVDPDPTEPTDPVYLFAAVEVDTPTGDTITLTFTEGETIATADVVDITVGDTVATKDSVTIGKEEELIIKLKDTEITTDNTVTIAVKRGEEEETETYVISFETDKWVIRLEEEGK